MELQNQKDAAVFPAPGQELYHPYGGTDPDFYIPADCDRTARGFSRWLRALPVFAKHRSS